jgi:TRAP-type C4-dicarboxylate transport system permease small subunit
MTLLTKVNYIIENAIAKVAKVARGVGGGILVGMTLFKVFDIILRYIFNRPIGAAVELQELGLLGLVYFAMVHCTAKKENIVIEVLVSKFKPRVRTVLACFVTFLGMVLFVIISFQCFTYAIQLKVTGYLTMMLRLPYYPFVLMASICSLYISLILFAQMIQSIIEIIRR